MPYIYDVALRDRGPGAGVTLIVPMYSNYRRFSLLQVWNGLEYH